jgi:flagellar biosynthetic protein FliR
MSMDWIPLITERFETFLLVFVRLGGIFFISPFFGNKQIPINVKIVLTLSISLLILPIIPVTINGFNGDLLEILFVVMKEVSLGAIIGFGSLLLFMAMQIAGQIIGFQMGFAIVNVIDPATQNQVSIIGEFKYLISIMIYLAIDGHHFLLSAITQSFTLVPPGTITFNVASADLMIRMSAEVFVIAIKIAAPAMVTLFLTSLSLGIIARTVPQMNVFIVGFPLKIAAGLLILAAGLPYFGSMFSKVLASMESNLSTLILLNTR